MASRAAVRHEEAMGSIGSTSAGAILKWDIQMLQSISQWLMASITEYEALINPLRLLGIPSPRPGKTSPATRAASPIYKTAPAGLPARIAAEVRDVVTPPLVSTLVSMDVPLSRPLLSPSPTHGNNGSPQGRRAGGLLKRRPSSRVTLGGPRGISRQNSRGRALSPLRQSPERQKNPISASASNQWSTHASLPRRTTRRAPPNWNHTSSSPFGTLGSVAPELQTATHGRTGDNEFEELYESDPSVFTLNSQFGKLEPLLDSPLLEEDMEYADPDELYGEIHMRSDATQHDADDIT